MGLASGDLNRRVMLRRSSVRYDEHNQPVPVRQEIGPVAASWRRATANERLASGQISAQVTDIFELRYSRRSKAADPTWELVFQSRIYDIVEVTEIGFHEGILIRASARVNGA